MCPSDDNLLRLLAGEVTAQTRDELEEHIAACEKCRNSLSQLELVWEHLGTWQVDPPPKDLTEAILARARRSGVAIPWRAAAAAVLLAAGVGIAAGILTSPRPTTISALPAASAEQVVRAIALDEFCDQPTALRGLFESEEEPS